MTTNDRKHVARLRDPAPAGPLVAVPEPPVLFAFLLQFEHLAFMLD
jgi:hypothetical protein